MNEMLTRRGFCVVAGLGVSALGTKLLASEPKTRSLRVISYNIQHGIGWPKNRPLAIKAIDKGQMAKRLAMELALYEPDIVTFSESPREEITQEVASLLRMNHVRFPSGGNWPGTLLSRFDIVESQNVPLGTERPKKLFTRHWGRAVLKLAGGELLIVHSAHLFPTQDPTNRLKEIKAMLASMKPDFDAGRSMLLMGDLNHKPDSAEYRCWIDAGWIDTFAKVGTGEGFTIPSDTPRGRIDYVMAFGPIAKQAVESRPLFEGAFRLNTADQESFALSDHIPQMAVFK
jgi:endonuclease/exonuclease/phosphatase family metal-dependent hydrolase